MKCSKQDAFTLIELLVSLSVLAILLSLATPRFSKLINNQREASHTNQLIRALNFARTTAITKNIMVSLCTGKTDCIERPNWQTDFIIFTDNNRNGLLDHDDKLLRQETLHENYSWEWSNFRNQRHMSFRADGTTYSLNGTFTLCENTTPVRRLILNAAGRVRLATPKSVNNCTP